MPKLKSNKYIKVLIFTILTVGVMAIVRIHPDKVYVGSFAGECDGICKVNYEITDNQITVELTSSDKNVNTVHKVLNGNFERLKFGIPLLILTKVFGSFGCPDCADGGGYNLGFKLLGIHFDYSVDRGSEPWYFKDMTDIIKSRLIEIQRLPGCPDK